MDIKDIRFYMECYEARSINKAAKSLFITPQGLGKALDRIETELQVKLFDRTKQGLVPTEAGVFFYKKSHRILESTRELEEGLEEIKSKKKFFKLGYSCGLIRMLSLDAIDKIQEDFENVELSIEEASNRDVKLKLVKNEIDLALVIGRVAADDVIEVELESKTMCAVVPKGHKYFNRKSLKIVDLKDEQLISLNEKYQSYDNLINSCEREGFYPHIRIKTMEAAMIYEFVREGIGIGIDVDIHNREGLFENVKLIPIKDAIPWSVYLVYKVEKRKDECLIKVEKAIKKNVRR